MTYTYKCKTCKSEQMHRVITGGAGVIYKVDWFTKRARREK